MSLILLEAQFFKVSFTVNNKILQRLADFNSGNATANVAYVRVVVTTIISDQIELFAHFPHVRVVVTTDHYHQVEL